MISKIMYFNKDKNIANDDYENISMRIKNDYIGWMYCIESEIMNVYEKNIVIVKISNDENEIIDDMKKYPKSKLIKKIKLNMVNSYYEIFKLMLFHIQLNNIFFNNKMMVKKEFKKIEKTKSPEEYYTLLLDHIKITYNHINTYFKRRRNYIPIYKISNVREKNIIRKKENTKLSILNYSSKIRKYGFLIELESDEIKYYYDGKIISIMGVVRYDEKNNILLSNPKVKKSIRIYNYEFGILLLRDQLKNKLYDANLYISNSDEITKIFEKIKKYFGDYEDCEMIKNAYLCDEYENKRK